MKNLKIECALIEEGKKRKFPQFNTYKVNAFFNVDGNRIEKWWCVEAKSVFAVDRWANLLIEDLAGSLKNSKKQIIKL